MNLFVANSTLKYGYKGALWTMLGCNIASLSLIIVAGIFIFSANCLSALILDIVALLGGFFLLYCGFIQVHDGLKLQISSSSEHAQGDFDNAHFPKKQEIKDNGQLICQEQPFSSLKLFISGFAVGVSNPKDVIFFIALFPPFLLKMGISLPISLLILAVIWCILDFLVLFLYGFLTKNLVKGIFEKIFFLLCGILFVGIGTYAIYWSILDLMHIY